MYIDFYYQKRRSKPDRPLLTLPKHMIGLACFRCSAAVRIWSIRRGQTALHYMRRYTKPLTQERQLLSY